MKNWHLGIIMSGVWLAGYNVARGRTDLLFMMGTMWMVFAVIMAIRDE